MNLIPKIFIELYLDEDVNVLVANLIKAKGFSAITVRDEGQLQKSDSEQFLHSLKLERTFVTHNRADFENLFQQYLQSEQNHYGIIIAVRHNPQEIARRLLKLINYTTADEMINQIRYI